MDSRTGSDEQNYEAVPSSVLQFPRDRFQGKLPEVPTETSAAVQGFAERVIALSKLGVAPSIFKAAIESSPVADEIQRAIGAAMLREVTGMEEKPLTGREQGIRVTGGPMGMNVTVSAAGAPVLVRSIDIEMHGNDDHVAHFEAFLEPPLGLVFRVRAVLGLADVATAWGYMLVPLMDKELRRVPSLFGRMVMNEHKAARVQLATAGFGGVNTENVEQFFAAERGMLESPIAGSSILIRANERNEGNISWGLLRPGSMKEIGVEKCHEWLRSAVSLELLQMVVEPTGYKLRKLNIPG